MAFGTENNLFFM